MWVQAWDYIHPSLGKIYSLLAQLCTSTWPPPFSIILSLRSRYASAAFLRISTVISAKAALILSFNPGIFAGRVTHTLDFKNPHMEKSHGVRSDEHGGQGKLEGWMGRTSLYLATALVRPQPVWLFHVGVCEVEGIRDAAGEYSGVER